MNVRRMLRELSAAHGIAFETLRTRWKNGYRGEQLLLRKIPYHRETVVNRKGAGPIPTAVTKPPPLPVRVPHSLRYR